MTNLLALLNLVSIISSSPTIQFSVLLNHGSSSDISFAYENNIVNWDGYKDYLKLQAEQRNCESLKSKGDGNDGSISDSIPNVNDYLNKNYSDYYWIRDDENCALTSDVSNHIPIEMQSSYFH